MSVILFDIVDAKLFAVAVGRPELERVGKRIQERVCVWCLRCFSHSAPFPLASHTCSHLLTSDYPLLPDGHSCIGSARSFEHAGLCLAFATNDKTKLTFGDERERESQSYGG
jgi:hypothetical protein